MRVRVIAGELRGRRIDVPRGVELRPTYDRVRESLFSMIEHRLEGARVLDLFAGTGSLGIESISRGAAEAVFVESDRGASGQLEQTLERFGIAGRSMVIRSDVLRFISSRHRRHAPFDVVFADPPYDTDLAGRVYDALDGWDGVAAGGLVVIEHRAADRLPETGARLTLSEVKRYGTIEVELHDVARDTGDTQRTAKEDL